MDTHPPTYLTATKLHFRSLGIIAGIFEFDGGQHEPGATLPFRLVKSALPWVPIRRQKNTFSSLPQSSGSENDGRRAFSGRLLSLKAAMSFRSFCTYLSAVSLVSRSATYLCEHFWNFKNPLVSRLSGRLVYPII